MSFQTTDELGRLLVRLHLVEPPQVDECLAELGAGGQDAAALLQALERRNALTSYQVSRLESGSSDGLVLGRYKLLYRNASGSFARVFRACSLDDGRMIGLKVLRQRWAKDPKTVAQFHREAELCRKLKHKNIVPIYEVASDGDYHFFTMEFIEGGNLRDFINIRKKLAPAEATQYVLDICEGLEYALRYGITHRDLKLTNVLMSIQGTARLVDFGLAGSDEASGSSAGDGVQRALEYVALERGSGAPTDDPRSDLYFLGGIYYELLSGVPPYPRTSSREERKDVNRYRNIRPLRSVEPNVPRAVLEVVERLMQFQPDGRYQTPTEACAALRAALAELDDEPNAAAGGAASPPSAQPLQPTVMCIESRVRHQDVLREYLSKRGFRVLMLSDVERGLTRLKATPPDCVVLMGDAIGPGVVKAYQTAVQLGAGHSVVCIAVLGQKQAEYRAQLPQSQTARVLLQPITLRDLRNEIDVAFEQRNGSDR